MAVLSRLANFIAKQITTPAAPPAGSNVLYPKADDNWYTEDSTGAEEQIQAVKIVRVSTTGAITLSGTQTIDGVALNVGDRVLVRHQGPFSGNNYDNGIWVVQTGAWTRATDANTAAKLAWLMVAVTEGSYHRGQVFKCAFQSTQTLGTDAVGFYSVMARADYGGVFSQPLTSEKGQMFFVGGERRLLVWDGTFFSNVKGVQNYGGTAPNFPGVGEIWLDSSATTASATVLPFFKGVPVSRSQAVTQGVNIPFTATEDTHAAWNSGSNYYTIPIPGLYKVIGQVKIDGTNTLGSICITNSSGVIQAWSPNQSGTGGFAGSQITDVFRFAAGDTVALRPQNTDALVNDATENTFLIIEYVRP